MSGLRIAVVGGGPAGIYAADALLYQQQVPVLVDVFDRLPTPFGLLRYGVAPDHLKIKSLSRQLQQVLDDARLRFFGNVAVGHDVTVGELRERYHAVLYAVGAPAERRLDLPGEDLAGCQPAGDFVAWYSGRPEVALAPELLRVPAVAVVGAGNVALDVVRLLSRDPQELAQTDLPEAVLASLRASLVTEVHLLARRSPAEARFTTKELRELGELSGVDVLLDPAELELSSSEKAALQQDPSRPRNLELLREWSQRLPTGAARQVHLHFRTRPVKVLGTDRVQGLLLEKGPAESRWTEQLQVGLVLSAIGYRGVPLAGVPFDEDRGVLPQVGSRVLRDGQVSPGEYASGWAARGPVGVLGTNRADGEQVTAAVLADSGQLLGRELLLPEVADLLRERGAEVVTCAGWANIDRAELALGAGSGRARSKIVPRAGLLEAARG